ncbi:MAG: helix-hairpin-helix domain-containing protein [Candidatus Symbiothrix sp.]|jgi:DNA uptake protein ComE-like DNA-binding protein|nr:helix-hairpin-helix domain-containing protein [Candidatus Symbiothrix sp.]
MNWKDFFYFSQRERRGILLLLVFIGGIFAGKLLFAPPQAEPIATEPTFIPEEPSGQTSEKPPYVPYFQQQERPQRKAYMHPPRPQEHTRTYYNRKQEEEARPATNLPPKAEKFAQGVVIELNTADSTDLVKIPGIGAFFAKNILSYKKILGGYHRIEQLQEVHGMYEELYAKISPFLKVDASQVAAIPVNKASLNRLMAHPYIDFYQARAIVEVRKKKGQLSSIKDLQLLDEFTDNDWLRIAPYLDF